MKDFEWILHRAQDLKGPDLASYMPPLESNEALAQRGSAFYLSLLGLRIFRAGLKHSVVDDKWPIFEQAFQGFNPAYVASLSDETLQQHLLPPGLLKHRGNLKA